MKVLLLKITSFFVNLGSMLVYNFHKHVKGIKTKRNVRYGEGLFRRFDIHYHKIDTNKNNPPRPVIIYFHGGGWTAYSKGIFSTLSRRLASMGYVVFNVNYKLAPKAKMEEIIADCISAILKAKELSKDYNGDSSRLVFAGDSAGAHISSYIASIVTNDNFEENNIFTISKVKKKEYFAKSVQKAREYFKNDIKGLLLFYGVYDLSTMLTSGFPNIRTYASAALYGKGLDIIENNFFSPINYISENYPPCFIASGEIDKLHNSQSLTFKEYLEDKGIAFENLFFSKEELRAMHAFMIFDGLYTNEKTLSEAKQFLKGVFE